jgi:hypothetical protein
MVAATKKTVTNRRDLMVTFSVLCGFEQTKTITVKILYSCVGAITVITVYFYKGLRALHLESPFQATASFTPYSLIRSIQFPSQFCIQCEIFFEVEFYVLYVFAGIACVHIFPLQKPCTLCISKYSL